MRTVAGIFRSRRDAEGAIAALRALGITERYVSLLTPGTAEGEVESVVPTTDTEQPGMGKALGGAVGGAMGVAGGATLGAAAASLLVPGVGPVIAAGLIGAALFGTGGAFAGAEAGGALEDNLAAGLPHDELYIYEDALRQGRTVIIAVAENETQAEAAQTSLADAGAESVDAAREQWWVGLRGAEEGAYAAQGHDFKKDEPAYRRGFESALHPQMRGVEYEQSLARLRERHGEVCEGDAFRCGFERGQAYQKKIQEPRRS